MGSFIGHVAPGFGFFLIGLWHLYNHIRLHSKNPGGYESRPWFPTSRVRYFELFLIMFGCSLSVSMELFIGPDRHQPFDDDGTIPSNHLHNFEHSLISLAFFTYAAFAIILDRASAVHGPARFGLTNIIGAIAFGQQLLMFRLHSSDHMGVEGQYHLLLQLLIFISLSTTLLGTYLPGSFLLSFVRSGSILFQGLWLMVMGFALWTPGLIPKGCYMNLEEGHEVVRCHSDEALHRAKSLVNIEFSWFVILVTIFAMSLYLVLGSIHGHEVGYQSLIINDKENQQQPEDCDRDERDDVEAQKKGYIFIGTSAKSFASSDMER
ncbi:hypothetical protein MLD38_017133 [Melastoma candidum]|uniref:Uncharacterized protein n=1 Tax=Melastoma candidum TaxID=119954 RepID=A0ACB9QPM8_9MYRT|nr:hypothetical protein MLD38_017133 [Melastoma candidum]